MQTASGAFIAAVAGQDQQVAYLVTVGLPATVNVGGSPVTVPATFSDLSRCVVSIQVDESVVTTAPDGTLLINGYPSASASVKLAGMLKQASGMPGVESQTAFWLFNPNDPTSILYRIARAGLTITIQAGLHVGGLTPEYVTIFTGSIDVAACSNGVVTLTCRDNRSMVTNQAALPPVITEAPYNAGLTSEFAVDSLLRNSSPGGFYSWAKQRPNCIFAVGMRSSIWPEKGSLSSAVSQFPTFGVGLYGTALVNSGGQAIPYILPSPILPSQDWFTEAIMGPGSTVLVRTNTGVDPIQHVNIVMTATGLSVIPVTASGTATGQTVSFSVTAPHEVGVQIHWPSGSTAITGTIYIDGVPTALSCTALNARSATATMVFPNITVDGTITHASIEGVQITTETAGVGTLFVPTAILDPSLNPLTALPDVSGKDTWAVLQEIASAENAVLGFDELGVFHFRNRHTIAAGTSQRTITSTASLATLDSLEQMSTVATHIQVPVNGLAIQALNTVWNASAPIAVNPGTLSVFAQTQNIVLNIQSPDSGYLPDVGGTAGASYWRGCTTADGTGAIVSSGISYTVTQLSATSLRIDIVNSNSFTVYLVNSVADDPTNTGVSVLLPGGQSVLGVTAPINVTGNGGTLLADAQWPPINEGGAAANPNGEVVLPLPANDWLQDLPTGQTLAGDLLIDLYRPRPLYRNVTIVADPRLQLCDRVTILDPDVSQVAADALIVGISTTLSADTWMQTIDARAIGYPGGWILGTAGRSELGTSTYL